MISAIAEHQTEMESLCRRYAVSRLELFGSATVGTDRRDQSDLDFLVEFEPRASRAYADNYFGLLEGLERLFGGQIDLVVASAIRNPYFRESVEQTKTLLYAA